MRSILYLFVIFFGISLACNFQAHVQSETEHDIWAQFIFHNKSKSHIIDFTKYGEMKNFTVTGKLCNLSPTILKTYNQYPKKGVKPIGETSAHLEGNGHIYYKIFHKESPMAVRSEGMLCAWGQCRVGK